MGIAMALTGSDVSKEVLLYYCLEPVSFHVWDEGFVATRAQANKMKPCSRGYKCGPCRDSVIPLSLVRMFAMLSCCITRYPVRLSWCATRGI